MFEKFHRGDIYSADLSPGIGSEQSGSRPCTHSSKQCGKLFQSYDYYCSNYQCKQKKQVPHITT